MTLGDVDACDGDFRVVESSACPVPIREVQSATAITGSAAEGGLVRVTGLVEAAAVPVPMLAVQCGGGGSMFVSLPLITLGRRKLAPVGSPVPMKADQ
jgi:hypothetical protein